MRLKPLIWIYEADSGNIYTETPVGKIGVIENQWNCIRVEINPNLKTNKVLFQDEYFDTLHKGVQRAEEWYRENFKDKKNKIKLRCINCEGEIIHFNLYKLPLIRDTPKFICMNCYPNIIEKNVINGEILNDI